MPEVSSPRAFLQNVFQPTWACNSTPLSSFSQSSEIREVGGYGEYLSSTDSSAFSMCDWVRYPLDQSLPQGDQACVDNDQLTSCNPLSRPLPNVQSIAMPTNRSCPWPQGASTPGDEIDTNPTFHPSMPSMSLQSINHPSADTIHSHLFHEGKEKNKTCSTPFQKDSLRTRKLKPEKR